MDYIINESNILTSDNSETKLAKQRRLIGYSQATLALKAGISLRTLQQYESRARDIGKASFQTLHLLARALQCPIESIVDINIDSITDCIVLRETGSEYDTAYEIITREITGSEAANDKKHGWKFDWHQIQKEGFDIIELYTPHDNHIQGRISFSKEQGFIYVDHVESAPHNIGHNGLYQGVGANLFAIACLISKELGFDGFVCFDSKNDSKVMNNYIETLHAIQIGHSQRMIIDDVAADYLIKKYQLEKQE